MTPPPVFRFAPSPNGDLHLGHALSALSGYAMARRVGGRFLVRIEDIDVARAREGHVRQILDDLAWLGIVWDGPVMRQSERFDHYRAAADDLERRGFLYPCWASRTEIADAARARSLGSDPDGAPLYPRLFKELPPGEIASRRASREPFALRLDMARAIDEVTAINAGAPLSFTSLDDAGRAESIPIRPQRWGDAVIVRKDVPASYHLAVVIDDAAQGVTHVTRGMDLLPATDIQRVLQVLLGLPQPVYHHHRLITDATGRKLSKSVGDTSLKSLRAAGETAASIRTRLGFAGRDFENNTVRAES